MCFVPSSPAPLGECPGSDLLEQLLCACTALCVDRNGPRHGPTVSSKVCKGVNKVLLRSTHISLTPSEVGTIHRGHEHAAPPAIYSPREDRYQLWGVWHALCLHARKGPIPGIGHLKGLCYIYKPRIMRGRLSINL
jgi:hypothetical protein